MKHRLAVVLTACALAAGTQVVLTAQPSSAAVGHMIRNHATGKCLQGTDNGTTYAHAVKMVPCNRSNSSIWWGASAGKIEMVRGGKYNSQICLSIPKSPKGDFPHDVDTTVCGNTAYNQVFSFGVASNYPIGSPEPCYVGHYAASDSWASCYVNSGSNTRWDWIS
ncbi:hypothetical protein [Streptomyces sp. NPDC047028]|uniref:hypothetical protein n=1 Tax=Streptomyces sp. NPDC047028 TaxID=3155793 RepID=UPI0033EFB97C